MAINIEPRIDCPCVVGSIPLLPITQASENEKVTETDKPSSESQKQKLVSGLFLDSEIDPDLKLIIECWPELSVELRSAICRMVL